MPVPGGRAEAGAGTELSLPPRPVYNPVMPLDPITAAIVNAIVSSAVEQILSAPHTNTTTGTTTAPVPSVVAGVPRFFPENTAKGTLVVFSPTTGEIDGKAVTIAPGVQIRDPYNMTILPGMIQEPVLVRYQIDVAGFVNKVWILSQLEAAQP